MFIFNISISPVMNIYYFYDKNIKKHLVIVVSFV